jgi:hypothetical protein
VFELISQVSLQVYDGKLWQRIVYFIFERQFRLHEHSIIITMSSIRRCLRTFNEDSGVNELQ